MRLHSLPSRAPGDIPRLHLSRRSRYLRKPRAATVRWGEPVARGKRVRDSTVRFCDARHKGHERCPSPERWPLYHCTATAALWLGLAVGLRDACKFCATGPPVLIHPALQRAAGALAGAPPPTTGGLVKLKWLYLAQPTTPRSLTLAEPPSLASVSQHGRPARASPPPRGRDTGETSSPSAEAPPPSALAVRLPVRAARGNCAAPLLSLASAQP